MKQLLSIEWIKISKLRATTVLLLVYMLLVPAWMFAWNYIFEDINSTVPIFPDTKTLWSFPTVWKFVTYSASYFNLMLCVLVVILTANEFSNRTMRQHIIDGLSKQKVIAAKFLVILGLAIFVSVYCFIVAAIFGISQSKSIDLWSNIHYVGLFFIQSLCYFGLAFLIGILIQKSALSIIIFYGYIFIEAMVGFFLPPNLYIWFPANAFAKLSPIPFLEILSERRVENGELILIPMYQNLLICGGYLCLIYLLAFWRLKKKDL